MKARAITRNDEINQVITDSLYCSIGMIDTNGNPYVLPFNFAWDGEYVFIHCAPDGKKIEALKSNPQVCLSFCCDLKMNYVNEDVACSWSMRYRSVLIYGQVEEINEYDEKVKILNLIMKKYSGKDDFKYNRPAVINVKVFRIAANKIEGRAYGY